MGVEIDAHCKPVAYWLWEGNPADAASGVGFFTGQRVRVPASEIIHVYRAERPQQVRGVPWCSSAIQTLHMLEGYQEAELVAARTASCKMGFYKIPPGEDFTPDAEGTQGPLSDASPGTFERLPTGWDFVQYDPQHPGANFDVFVKSILRSAAGGLNVAYNNFANDLDGVSYSSIRSGTLEERENWMVVQDWFINSFCSPLYSAWLESALLTQSVKLPFAKLEKFRADTWTGRRWPWVDPLNDVQTREKELQLGITSKSQMVSEQGKDFAEVQAQIAADRDIEEANSPEGAAVITTDGAPMAVQDTAMNGAQVTAAVDVVKAIVLGDIPRETGVMMLSQFFKIDYAAANEMVGEAGKTLKKKAPIDAGSNL
jgi:lambda family phage portal protein